LAAVVGWFVLVSPGRAPAAEESSPLALVPEQAPVVVHVHGLGRTKDRLVTLAKNAAPDLGPLIETQLDKGINQALKGRELKGLAPDGPILVVLLELPQGGDKEPMAAVIARVTNYKDFRDGILKEEERKSLKKEGHLDVVTTEDGETLYLLDRKGYAVVSPRKEAVEQLAKNPASSLDAKLSKDDVRGLTEPDVSVYVDLKAINKEYGPAIGQFRQQVTAMIDQVGPLFGGGNEAMLDMVKSMYAGLFQAVEDGQSALLSVDFRPEGIALHIQERVGADSKTNQVLKSFHSTDFAQFGRLPSGAMFYTGMNVDAKTMQQLQPWVFGMLASAGADKDLMQAAMKDMRAAKPHGSVAAANIPVAGIQVWQYGDPSKAVEGQLKFFRSIASGGSFQFMALKEKPEIKENERTYRDFKLNHVHFTWDLEKLGGGLPGAPAGLGETMKKMMGEGMSMWFGTDGKTYVQASGKDWKEAKHYLDAYLDGKGTLEKDAGYAAVRKHLPQRSTMLVLVNLPRYIGVIAQMFVAQADAPSLKGKPSYLGMAITLQPELGSFDLWIPGSAVSEMRKVMTGGGQ
jgi:hypothetical protein